MVLDTLEEEFLKEKYLTKEEHELLDSHDSLKQKSMLLAQLKNHQKLFDYRLYRDQCIRSPEGIYIKDLRILANRDL